MIAARAVLEVPAADQFGHDAAGQDRRRHVERQIDSHGDREHRRAPARAAALEVQIQDDDQRRRSAAPMAIMPLGNVPPNMPSATDLTRLACGAGRAFTPGCAGSPMP